MPHLVSPHLAIHAELTCEKGVGGREEVRTLRDSLVKGYEGSGLVPEVHHGIVGDHGVHETDHMMFAQGLLLTRSFVCDYVQSFVHLRETDKDRQTD